MSDANSKDKKLDELLEIIKKSPALNGGFTRLSDSVNEIKDSNLKVLYELQTVKSNQGIHSEKLEELHLALYDPDTGLYRRVSHAITATDGHLKEIEEIKTIQEEIQEKVVKFETTDTTLKNIAGKDLEDLRSTISARKTFIRGLWVLGGAIIVGLAKIAWDIIIAFS
jgi:chromosome segregation ATPase